MAAISGGLNLVHTPPSYHVLLFQTFFHLTCEPGPWNYLQAFFRYFLAGRFADTVAAVLYPLECRVHFVERILPSGKLGQCEIVIEFIGTTVSFAEAVYFQRFSCCMPQLAVLLQQAILQGQQNRLVPTPFFGD